MEIAFGSSGLVDLDEALLERLDRAGEPLAEDPQVLLLVLELRLGLVELGLHAASRLRSAATSPVSWSIWSL